MDGPLSKNTQPYIKYKTSIHGSRYYADEYCSYVFNNEYVPEINTSEFIKVIIAFKICISNYKKKIKQKEKKY